MCKIEHILLLLILPLIAFSSWYDQKLEGWYYFEDSSSEKKETLTPEEADKVIVSESQKLKQLLSLALISPTPENVELYIRAQRQWIQQSNTFAQAWGKTLLEYPEIGDFLTTPTSTYGILTKRAYDLEQRKTLLKNLSKSHFLLFFFKGNDPFSQRVAEVAHLFASSNGWKYKAVSLDGVGLAKLQEFELDKGLSKKLGVNISPSFYVINPIDNQAYPVGAGLISLSELESNIETQLGGSHE